MSVITTGRADAPGVTAHRFDEPAFAACTLLPVDAYQVPPRHGGQG